MLGLIVSHVPVCLCSPELLLSVNVAGFILIKEVDVANGMVQFLAPCDGPLPGKYLLATTVKSTVA